LEKGGESLIRKDVVIAVLATFCLTSTLFMITTSKSQSGVGEYNPWADINGDGAVDIFDIVGVAVSFGSTGDSTKNVNVTNSLLNTLVANLPTDENGNLKVRIIESTQQWSVSFDSIPPHDSVFVTYQTVSYRKISFVLKVFAGGCTVYVTSFEGFGYDEFDVPGAAATTISKTYEIAWQDIQVRIYNTGSNPIDVYLTFYMTT
jgi:hypothetical protein